VHKAKTNKKKKKAKSSKKSVLSGTGMFRKTGGGHNFYGNSCMGSSKFSLASGPGICFAD